MTSVEKWGLFEVTFNGPKDGNPFTEETICAVFKSTAEEVTVSGFYDGDGVYKIRFMPSFEGTYTYEASASFHLKNPNGTFTVTAPSENNHGPMRTHGYHFEYEDGTAFYPVGTTCYVWELQSEALQKETLATLKEGYFNKIRFCVHPKHYLYNLHEPISYPYEGTPCTFEKNFTGSFYQYMGVQPGNNWDFTRFNPEHFQNVENAIGELLELGIEADLILFHPYDRWGFSHLTPEQDAAYLRYALARFGAYRNIWWSLANEYDLLRDKTVKDWEAIAKIIVENDPYHHLRSIHNCGPMYDHTRPWITHCSIQRQDVYKCAEYTDDFRTRYGKPIMLDEIAYEGDIDQGWGNISGQELVRRYWEAALRGGYATHGETYDTGDDILWWSHGGKLHGDSPERIRFLHSILKQTPGLGLKRMDGMWDELAATADCFIDSSYYLYYYGFNRPSRRMFMLNPQAKYQVEVISTWDMTITPMGEFSGIFSIPLPRKEYMAIRVRRI